MEGGGAFNLDRQLRVIVAGADGTEEQTVPLEIAVQFRFFKDILCLDGAEVVTADLAQVRCYSDDYYSRVKLLIDYSLVTHVVHGTNTAVGVVSKMNVCIPTCRLACLQAPYVIKVLRALLNSCSHWGKPSRRCWRRLPCTPY